MVFIGNPRRGTNRVGGDRIILRSMHNKLHLQHTLVTLYLSFLVCVFYVSDRGFRK